jgi:hypothetical protein
MFYQFINVTTFLVNVLVGILSTILYFDFFFSYKQTP